MLIRARPTCRLRSGRSPHSGRFPWVRPRSTGRWALGTGHWALAYTDSAGYLSSAIDYALGCCDAARAGPAPAGPSARSCEAAASARRLDDAFRTYLAERGAKPLSLADTTTLVTGAAGLRPAADSVLALWQSGGQARLNADQTEARRVVLGAAVNKSFSQ